MDDKAKTESGEATPVREGIAWRELLTDKAVDIVLIPLGLFVALWFQGWIDDRKEQAEYVDQLRSFRTEIAANRDKGRGMESQLGPLADQAPESVLGPLGHIFPLYDRLMAHTTELVDCAALSLTPATAATAEELAALAATVEGREQIAKKIADSDAIDARLKACEPILAGTEGAPDVVFEVVDLSPLYRYEVWQMYLQDGIKLFKSEEARALGRKLGEAYAVAQEIERRVAEIEDAYNEELMRRLGAQTALQAELDHLFELVDFLGDPLPRLRELTSEVRRTRFSMTSFEAMLGTKVARVKVFVDEMGTRLGDIDGLLAAEIANGE